MKHLSIILICFLLAFNKINAQKDSAFTNVFYVGPQAGYLLNNKSLNKNPLYHFSNGMYAELMGGWRNKFFGWELAIGALNIKRDKSKFNIYQPAAIDVLKAQTGKIYKNAIDSGQIGNAIFRFPTTTQQNNLSEDFKGFYALTGPSFWINRKKLQIKISLKGGAISRKFGYYLVNGKGISPDSITVSYHNSTETNTLGKATVTPNATYVQFGMTENLFNGLKKPILDATTKKSIYNIDEKAEIQFIARAGANAEYFLSHNLSINAGVNYWFIPSPTMKGMDTLGGNVNATLRSYSQPTTPVKRDYNVSLKRTYEDEKSLGFLSASIGVKLWLGKKKNNARKNFFTPIVQEKIVTNKDLVIWVVNKVDQKPVSNATIKIYKEGATDYTETSTLENGYTQTIENLLPGNYVISCVNNGQKMPDVMLTEADFKAADKTIMKKIEL